HAGTTGTESPEVIPGEDWHRLGAPVCGQSEAPPPVETGQRRITRGTIPSCARASCTDSTENRTDGTHGAGIIRAPVPRPVPRPAPLHPSHAHCGLADGGKARRVGMTLRHEQPVAG